MNSSFLQYLTRITATVQGVYYLATGLWPFFSIASFEAVTGPKMEVWLINTVALFLIVCAVVLLVTVFRRSMTLEIVLLGAGLALALGIIDVTYALRGVISYVYLVDAAVELVFLAGWLIGSRCRAALDCEQETGSAG